MLLPVGANLDTLQSLELGEAVGPVSVLLLAQSGYAPLAPPEWLQALNPDLVVISVGVADKDGLPSAETLQRRWTATPCCAPIKWMDQCQYRWQQDVGVVRKDRWPQCSCARG